MIVDVHAHYFPQDYLTLMDAELGSSPDPVERRRTATVHTGAMAQVDLRERLELLDRTGIDVQILSLSLLQPYLPEYSKAVDAARLANDRYAEVCVGHGDRFRAFGALPLPHVDQALAELSRCLDELGMVGVTVGCSIRERQLDDPAFEPIFAELDQRATTVLVHPVGRAFIHGVDAYGLDWKVGALFEDTVTALRLAMSGITERFPRMKMIIPHLGGTIPFALARIKNSAPGVEDALRSMWFDTVNDQPGALTCACEALGADRLLFGTDFPWATPEQFVHRLTRFDGPAFSDDDRRQIGGARAASLVGLPAHA